MELSKIAHSKLLMAQRIYRLTQTARFSEAENKADPESRKKMESYIKIGDIDELEDMVFNLTKDILEYRLIRDLRLLAGAYDIPKSQELTREQLLVEIRRAKNDSDGGD